MSEYRGRIALVGLVIIVFMVGVAFELNSAVPGVTTTGPSSSSTQTSAKTAVTRGANVSTVASNGLRLSTSVNATDLTVGQNLNISVSLFNTTPTANVLAQGGRAGFPPGNWTFYGVPLATWPECTQLGFPFGWQFPIQVLILDGNYTAQQLSSLANVSLPADPCAAGIGSAFPTYTFEPNSDLINITYFADGGAGFGHVGLFRSASHFTIDGYWNLAALAEQANGSYISEPALCQLCGVPSSTPFAPGVYTVGVVDEWGQYDVLHFQVGGAG
jgi:hypothetical protein